MRFNRLRRDIEGISQKMLSQTLKNLERDGLVQRTAYPTVPVTVEYSLTPLGENFDGDVRCAAPVGRDPHRRSLNSATSV